MYFFSTIVYFKEITDLGLETPWMGVRNNLSIENSYFCKYNILRLMLTQVVWCSSVVFVYNPRQ